MIIYVEKGIWLHEAIAAAGHWLIQQNGVWVSDDDVAVQAIIDAFDPLPFAKEDKTKELKTQTALLSSEYYAFMNPAEEPDKAASFIDLFEDFYEVIHPASRNALDGRLLACYDLGSAQKDAIVVIEAMTDWTLVMAYDVVNTPNWP